MSLNFGHTFAQAIEMATDNYFKKDYLRHGEAVGIGIMCEIFYANKGKSKLLSEIESILKFIIYPQNFSKKRK